MEATVTIGDLKGLRSLNSLDLSRGVRLCDAFSKREPPRPADFRRRSDRADQVRRDGCCDGNKPGEFRLVDPQCCLNSRSFELAVFEMSRKEGTLNEAQITSFIVLFALRDDQFGV